MNIEKITEIQTKLQALRTQYVETARTEFSAGCKELFNAYPQLKSVSFHAYTPYFNDGDTCEYRVSLDYPLINGYDEHESDEYGDDSINIWKQSHEMLGYGVGAKPNPSYNPYAKQIINNVKAFFRAFEEEIYKDLFGDHVTITVTPNEVTTKTYDHE